MEILWQDATSQVPQSMSMSSMNSLRVEGKRFHQLRAQCVGTRSPTHQRVGPFLLGVKPTYIVLCQYTARAPAIMYKRDHAAKSNLQKLPDIFVCRSRLHSTLSRPVDEDFPPFECALAQSAKRIDRGSRCLSFSCGRRF
jgi:hypothetical protein